MGRAGARLSYLLERPSRNGLGAQGLHRKIQKRAVAYVGTANGGFGEKGNVRVRAALTSPRDRVRSDEEIGLAVMDAVGTLPEVVNLEMSRDGSGAGALGATKPIVVQILGTKLEALQEAALQIQSGIRAIPGTMNVNADLIQTRPELQVQLDRQQALRLGLRAIGQEPNSHDEGEVSRMSLTVSLETCRPPAPPKCL